MVHLTDDYRQDAGAFAAAGITVPGFDQAAFTGVTPTWLHLGAGNLCRALHAQVAQALAAEGALPGGLAVAESFSPDIVTAVFRPYAHRHLNVVMPAEGPWTKELIASVAAAYVAQPGSADWGALQGLAADPALQLVTLTITEKGYGVTPAADPALTAGGPDAPATAMGTVAALLLARWRAGGAPVAVVSTDNFSRNGDRLSEAVQAVTAAWRAGGAVPAGFTAWLADPDHVTFPSTMIDRITPNPSAEVAARLAAEGFGDTELVRISANTVMAPFANAEAAWYLVVEDRFPNGRPPLERAGVYLGDKAMVSAADEMKVTACLNPLHTALAVFGVVLGATSIAAEMADPDLAALVRRLGYAEGLPVAPDPQILHPRDFLDDVVERRLPNRNLPDTPQRIAADTSQKLPIRFGETLKKYGADDAARLQAIPLVLAGWLRYLLGVGDDGAPVTLSPDPRLEEFQAALGGVTLGHVSPDQAAAAARLASGVVGTDLVETQVARYFQDLAAGPGAVRHTLKAFHERTAL